MSIEKMSLVNLRGDKAYLDEALLCCASSGCFHPETATSLSEYSSALTTMKEENSYSALIKRMSEMADHANIELHYTGYDTLTMESRDFSAYVTKLSEQLQKLLSRKSGVSQIIESHNLSMAHLQHLQKLDEDFDDIFKSRFLEIRFGRMPVESYDKLHYYQDKPFVIFSYDNDGAYHWCLYICAAADKQEVDGLFNSLYFERIHIPDYAHGTPEQSLEFIEKDLKKEKAELAKINTQIADIIKEQSPVLCMIYSKAKVLADAFDMRKYAAFIKTDFVLLGFIPKKNEAKFTQLIEAMDKKVEITYREADSDARLLPPVRLHNNRLLKPFEMFVEMYGLPSYKDVDPTPFVGLSYILLFGMMFGDMGQGLVICLLGLFLAKKKGMALGGIMSRIGVSSMAFGFFYGSVFGFEELLVPIHRALFGVDHIIHVMAPSSTNLILMAAIGVGVFIIVSAILMNIFLGLRQRDMERWIFSSNGLAGLVFYTSIVYAAVSTLLMGQNVLTPIYIVGFIAVPLIIMFMKEPLGRLLHKKKMFPDGVGSFILESFFEMFEVLLSFVTNTMSFLRVGGFILSHAGMMAVVMTLSNMVGSGASPIVIIIGNIFVMCMEGLIVGIQVLRLEFYEIFSRFFDGDGKPFEPAQSGLVQ